MLVTAYSLSLQAIACHLGTRIIVVIGAKGDLFILSVVISDLG